jgi:CDP-2,3-bis-(O-geranylgeranyl)-sn-glycerol synthase
VVDAFLSALWFFAPAGIANMMPVFAAKTPWLKDWKTPMDFGKTYKGQRIFGANKTWRGFVVGIIGATLFIAFQKYLYSRSSYIVDHSWISYQPARIWLLGPLFAIGVILADAVESFFKRQRNIAPGHSWFPCDQIDYVVGGCLFAAPIAVLTAGQYLWILVVYFGTHLLIVYLGYLAGVREKPI